VFRKEYLPKKSVPKDYEEFGIWDMNDCYYSRLGFDNAAIHRWGFSRTMELILLEKNDETSRRRGILDGG